ncbi:MAG: (2Fe-2S)-binding protein [Porticoccaceae bacterium]|jgi:isoquinoline 1-oxidoreductase alpha subunit
MKLTLNINGADREITVEAGTPLLWVLRDYLNMTGTKYSCGIGQCSACAVHIDGDMMASCIFPAEAAVGKKITTIEGLSQNGASKEALAVQRAWEEIAVVQCGFCQSGQVMAATALLARNAAPSAQEIDLAMMGNICRCATYARIKKGVNLAAQLLAKEVKA